MYASDGTSGAAAMTANIGDGARRTRHANGRLVTARRSVAPLGQHSELVQPGQINLHIKPASAWPRGSGADHTRYPEVSAMATVTVGQENNTDIEIYYEDHGADRG